LHFGFDLLWQFISGEALDIDVDFLVLEHFVVAHIASSLGVWVGDEFVKFVEELDSCLRQVNLGTHILYVSVYIRVLELLESYSKVVGRIYFESFVLFVFKLITLRIRSEFHAVVLVSIDVLQVHQQSPHFTLHVPLPHLVDVIVLRQDLDLDEVGVSLEERELLKQPLPGGFVVGFFLHQMFGYFHCFFEFSDHHVPSC
jgi:hypothetical protein